MVKLRKFLLTDLEKVMEIEKASFARAKRRARDERSSANANRDVYPNLLFEKYYKEYPEGFIVAENNGEIVGYTIGRPKNNQAEIISLAVKPDWRQKGIGKALTEFLINHFREKNVKEISLSVRTRNQVAISFYQNLGFEISKKIKNYYRNGDDAFLMKKEV